VSRQPRRPEAGATILEALPVPVDRRTPFGRDRRAAGNRDDRDQDCRGRAPEGP